MVRGLTDPYSLTAPGNHAANPLRATSSAMTLARHGSVLWQRCWSNIDRHRAGLEMVHRIILTIIIVHSFMIMVMADCCWLLLTAADCCWLLVIG